MPKTLKEKNQMQCNKEARKRYNKANFKYQTISLKNEEMEEINNYCKENGIPKNTLFRKAVMQYIGKPID
jgi:hypothetical protein